MDGNDSGVSHTSIINSMADAVAVDNSVFSIDRADGSAVYPVMD